MKVFISTLSVCVLRVCVVETDSDSELFIPTTRKKRRIGLSDEVLAD